MIVLSLEIMVKNLGYSPLCLSLDNFSDTFLEFLDIPQHHQYKESELEEKLIQNLQSFLLELGKGFAFVEMKNREEGLEAIEGLNDISLGKKPLVVKEAEERSGPPRGGSSDNIRRNNSGGGGYNSGGYNNRNR
jgi:RNA recognition motif-containing protein